MDMKKRLGGYTEMSNAVQSYVLEKIRDGVAIESIAFDLRTAFVAAMPDNEAASRAIQSLVAAANRDVS